MARRSIAGRAWFYIGRFQNRHASKLGSTRGKASANFFYSNG
jgi:hypothetical protein